MAALFFTISPNLAIIVIPNTRVHQNGHQVITYTYSVFNNKQAVEPAESISTFDLEKDKMKNPDYMGFITFEDPGKLFNYTDDGSQKLSLGQVEEIIEHISHYRDNPGMWRHIHR